VYLPTDYQPKYAYPLVVLFHADGECEDHAARLVPLLSRRNYVALCLRGTVKLGLRSDGRSAFGWNGEADRPAKLALTYTTAQFNIHPDRIFFLGVGEGASAAYRFARSLRKCSLRPAGFVALNGSLPEDRAPATDLSVLVAHGATNPVVPFSAARRASTALRAAGADVRLNRYSTSHHLHADMLRDANRWIMNQVAAAKG
jgi:phospholipase/carboxylesterase